jgi:OOP family OmpA-OmpF porin
MSAEQQLATTGSIRLENVYFETNSARLTAESTGPLDEAAAALAKYPALKIEVEGHTDVTGKAAHNRQLSQARAETVRAYLLKHSKLKKTHVTAKGYGSAGASPVGSSAEQLKQDRRVVLRVVNPEALPKSIEIQH